MPKNKLEITAYGTLVSMGPTVVKDTTVTKFKFKITGTSDSKEFAKVLEDSFGVEDVNISFPLGSTKADLRDYGVYVSIDFGTELEQLVTFSGILNTATFTHTRKDTGDGVDETVTCTVDGIKNRDGANDILEEWIKRKELNPQSGKKVLIPIKFEITSLDENPVTLTPVDEDEE
jgi:hypothetical protein